MPPEAARCCGRPQPRRRRHGQGCRVHGRGLPDPARQPRTPLRPRARQHLGRRPQPRPRPGRCRPARRQRQQSAAVPLCHPAVPSRRRRRRQGRRLGAGPAAGRARRPGRAYARPGRCRRRGAPPARLADLLADAGDLDGLRALADADDCAAALRLADLLAGRGDLDGAAQILRARADAGDDGAAEKLADLLAGHGDLDGAAHILAPLADAGDWDADFRAADLLAEPATWTGCAPWPTPATGLPPSGWPSCWPSAATWTGPRRYSRPCRRRHLELRARPTPETSSPPGGWPSCWPSAATWTGRAHRATRADAGDGTPPSGWPSCWPSAATWTEPRRYCAPGPTPGPSTPPRGWPSLLAERGDLDGLRARADAGDGYAACAAGRAAGRAQRGDLERAARPGRRRRRVRHQGSWPFCWPSAATWTGCAPGPTPAAAMPPRG